MTLSEVPPGSGEDHGPLEFAADSDGVEWTADTGGTDVHNEILFCGYRWDSLTGLYHVRHRAYHPTLGRWLQRDPAGYVDGMNLYEYCSGRPPFGVDPSGLGEKSPGNPSVWSTAKQCQDHFADVYAKHMKARATLESAVATYQIAEEVQTAVLRTITKDRHPLDVTGGMETVQVLYVIEKVGLAEKSKAMGKALATVLATERLAHLAYWMYHQGCHNCYIRTGLYEYPLFVDFVSAAGKLADYASALEGVAKTVGKNMLVDSGKRDYAKMTAELLDDGRKFLRGEARGELHSVVGVPSARMAVEGLFARSWTQAGHRLASMYENQFGIGQGTFKSFLEGGDVRLWDRIGFRWSYSTIRRGNLGEYYYWHPWYDGLPEEQDRVLPKMRYYKDCRREDGGLDCRKGGPVDRYLIFDEWNSDHKVNPVGRWGDRKRKGLFIWVMGRRRPLPGTVEDTSDVRFSVTAVRGE